LPGGGRAGRAVTTLQGKIPWALVALLPLSPLTPIAHRSGPPGPAQLIVGFWTTVDVHGVWVARPVSFVMRHTAILWWYRTGRIFLALFLFLSLPLQLQVSSSLQTIYPFFLSLSFSLKLAVVRIICLPVYFLIPLPYLSLARSGRPLSTSPRALPFFLG
jgi:hypothetical protein